MFLEKKKKGYYESFWVGLIDGDGSIIVNHWRKKILQFRMVIKLKNTEANSQILLQLKNCLGVGNVVVSKDKNFVLWVENNIKKIHSILVILEKYPPLTTRLNLQLEFFKKWYYCERNFQNVKNYLNSREFKYNERSVLIKRLQNQSLETLEYFPGWFSGFVEAEGCFTLREKSKGFPSFSIAQLDDDYLLLAIHRFVGAQNKVRYLPKTNLYLLEIYRQSVFVFLKNHFTHYPLLGEKKLIYLSFEKTIFQKVFE